ncbi:MAG TPA: BatA domain-containing protein [Tepidisphaeraceae bacterium]
MFLNPILLAGVAAAAVPLVLHLLGRVRVRRTAWGAMLFLRGAAPGDVARSRLRQWTPLVLRTLAVAAIALAMARPARGPSSAGPSAAGPFVTAGDVARTVVLVADATASAGYVEAGGPRIDQVREAALGVIARLSRGDQAGLVTLGFDAAADAPVTTDLQDIASRLAALTTGPRSADLAEGVRRAEALLAAAGAGESAILCVADRQAAAWQPLTAADGAGKAAVTAAAVGSTRWDNASVRSLRQITIPAVVGHPVAIDVGLHNDGAHPLAGVGLSVQSAGRVVDTGAVDLPPGGTTVRRYFTPTRPGSATVTAEISASGAAADDVLDLAIDAVAPLAVRIVYDGPPRAAAFLQAALAPHHAAGEKAGDAFAVGATQASEWRTFDPAAQSVLVLVGSARPDDARWREIEQFVYRGGGLWLIPGTDTTAEQWNRDYWRDGQGPAPAPAASMEAAAGGGMPALAPLPGSAALPDAAALTGARSTGGVGRWLRFVPSPSASVLGALQNNDPWLLSRPFGRGRVVAVAAPLDDAGGDLVYAQWFPAVVQATARHLAAARHVDRNVAPGAVIEHSFAAPRERSAYVARPDGRTHRVPLAVRDGIGSLVYTTTDLPGRYVVRTGGAPAIEFVVGGDDRESVGPLLDDAAIDRTLAGSKVRRVAPAALADAAGQRQRTREYALPVLAVAAALLVIEQVATSRADAAAGRAHASTGGADDARANS